MGLVEEVKLHPWNVKEYQPGGFGDTEHPHPIYLNSKSLQTLSGLSSSIQSSLFPSLSWFMFLIRLKLTTQLTAEPINGAQALPTDYTPHYLGCRCSGTQQNAFKSRCSGHPWRANNSGQVERGGGGHVSALQEMMIPWMRA